MKCFVSLHHELNDTNFNMDPSWAGSDLKYQKLYGSAIPEDEWQKMWKDKCTEVIDKYHPDILYHDAWPERVDQDYPKSYMAYFFNDAAKNGREVIVTYKGNDMKVTFTKKKDAVFTITSYWPGGVTKAPSFTFTLKELSTDKLDKNVISVELFGLKKIESCTFEHTAEG
jgi:alpha-L-fucosidase